MRAALLATLAPFLCGCPSRDDFVLVPEIVGPAGTCGGSPETLTLSFRVRWANGDRADPVNVVVDAHVNVLDSASGDMAGPRILHESDGTFDGSLGKGETAVVDYSATLDEPGFGCPAVCGGEVVLQLLYGIEIEAEGTPPVPDTEVRSVPFTFDCG